MKNFLALNRIFFTTDIWCEERQFSRAEALIDLIQMARYSERKGLFRFKGKVLAVGRGELVASYRYLGSRWQWSRSKVQLFLKNLSEIDFAKIRIEKGISILCLKLENIYEKIEVHNEIEKETPYSSSESKKVDCSISGERQNSESRLEAVNDSVQTEFYNEIKTSNNKLKVSYNEINTTSNDIKNKRIKRCDIGLKRDRGRTVKGQKKDESKIVKTEKKVKEDKKRVLFENFLTHFNHLRRSQFRGSKLAFKQFCKRLEDGYSYENIKFALQNCAESTFHRNNPNHLTPEFITREDKVEKYLNYAENKVVRSLFQECYRSGKQNYSTQF